MERRVRVHFCITSVRLQLDPPRNILDVEGSIEVLESDLTRVVSCVPATGLCTYTCTWLEKVVNVIRMHFLCRQTIFYANTYQLQTKHQQLLFTIRECTDASYDFLILWELYPRLTFSIGDEDEFIFPKIMIPALSYTFLVSVLCPISGRYKYISSTNNL